MGDFRTLLGITDWLLEEVTSSEELDDEQISKFISEAPIEDHDHVVLSNDTAEVITYIAGYISYSLLKKVNCDECIGKLKQDPVTNNYVQSLNQGLSLPPSALNHYTYTAFAILDTYEYQIRSFSSMENLRSQFARGLILLSQIYTSPI